MSPEQAAGREDIDGRADIWSLGVVMYEALTGTLPHQAANYNALMVRILTQDSAPVMTRKPDLPPSVCAIVDACSGNSGIPDSIDSGFGDEHGERSSPPQTPPSKGNRSSRRRFKTKYMAIAARVNTPPARTRFITAAPYRPVSGS